MMHLRLEKIIKCDNLNPVIQSFADKETQKIFDGGASRKLPSDILDRAEIKLRQIHNSDTLDQLRIPPSNRLELLKGDRKNFHCIRINSQWRIVFRWESGHAYEVQILDYH